MRRRDEKSYFCDKIFNFVLCYIFYYIAIQSYQFLKLRWIQISQWKRYKIELRKMSANEWLEGAYVLLDRYKDKKKVALECFEEAQEEFYLADGIASKLLEDVCEKMQQRFYLNPMNETRQFEFSLDMLSKEIINTTNNNILQRARVSLSALKRKRDRYQSLCNQSLMLEERIDLILDMLDQNEDIDLTGDTCEHMKGQRAKMFIDDLENVISGLTEKLKNVQYDTKQIAEDVDNGSLNKATQSKEHVDEYVSEFLKSRGIRKGPAIVQLEEEKELSLV